MNAEKTGNLIRSLRIKKGLTQKELAQMIDNVEREMREAAKNLDFERAMELRDILFEMKLGTNEKDL